MNSRVLIVGLGISGMSAAIAMHKIGWNITIVERSPERRKGGYFIGLRDEGKNAAEALGILDSMNKRTPDKAKFWDIRKDDKRTPVADLTNESNAPIAVLRGDIEEALWVNLPDDIDIRFNTHPTHIENSETEAIVTLKTGDNAEVEERFDLVIGADGVRSSVRQMIFGPDKDYLDPLGTMLCAFPLLRPVNGIAREDGIIYAENGRSLVIFPLADRPSTALFSYRTKDVEAQFKQNHVDQLRHIFAGMNIGGFVDDSLEDLQHTDDFLFDAVTMVKMPKWSKGRVLLIGDAAWCLTLYSGMGASAGMMGGVAIGKALANAGNDIQKALHDFEEGLRPFVRKNQRFIALRSQLFVPSSNLFIFVRRFLWKILISLSRK